MKDFSTSKWEIRLFETLNLLTSFPLQIPDLLWKAPENPLQIKLINMSATWLAATGL